MRIIASFALLAALALPSAHASSNDSELVLDSNRLAQLELRAEHAGSRERCYLYTELIHVYTEVAGKQIAAGDIEHATATLKRVQQFAGIIHTGLARDTKRLKDAEILLHNSTYRLGEYLHIVSSEDTELVQATKKQLDQIHEELLAQVFTH